MSRKIVAVFGATGGQGASVARELARHPDFMVRALTRDVYSQHAQRLKQDGAGDLIGYDPFDRASIQSALTGAYACFVNTITDYNDPNCFENEKLQGRLIAEACKNVGVQHVVFSSQLHTTRVMGTLVRHMVAKAEIEDYMRDIGLPVTCLIMPVYFEDFCGIFKPVTSDGYTYELLLPMGFTPLDMMSVEDLGPVVTHVLQNRSAYVNKTLSVSGDKLTMREVAAVLSRYLGPRKVFKDKQLTCEEFRQLDIPGAVDWAQMFNFFVRVDQRYNVMATRKLNPNMQNFETWVRNRRDVIDQAIS